MGRLLKVKGAAGTKVRLRFAEILNPDGTIYTANLRNADAPMSTFCGAAMKRLSPRISPSTVFATSR